MLPTGSITNRSFWQANARNMQSLRQTLETASRQVATGRADDLATHLNGDLRSFGTLTHKIRMYEALGNSLAENATRYAAAQGALERVSTTVGGTASSLILISDLTDNGSIDVAADLAKRSFLDVVTTLNGTAGGQFLFSGQAHTTAPLAPGTDILAALGTAASTATTSADVVAAVDAWMAASPGGYGDLAYLGSASLGPGFLSAAGVSSDFPVTADHAAIRDVISGLALGALAANGLLAGDPGEQANLLRTSAERLMTAQSGLLASRSAIGSHQEAIENNQAEIETTSSALKKSQADMVAIDPYEAATSLEATRQQLETLFAMTARLSGLSLTGYLR